MVTGLQVSQEVQEVIGPSDIEATNDREPVCTELPISQVTIPSDTENEEIA